MYTGIIQELGTITNVVKRANTHGISIRASSDFLTDPQSAAHEENS